MTLEELNSLLPTEGVEGRLFQGQNYASYPDGSSQRGPFLALMLAMQAFGEKDTERMAWRILQRGEVSCQAPFLYLSMKNTHFAGLPSEPFDPIVVQRILSLAGIIRHSRYDEWKRGELLPKRALEILIDRADWTAGNPFKLRAAQRAKNP